MNKIVYYIWNVSIIALIVISVIPFSTGLSNVVLGISMTKNYTSVWFKSAWNDFIRMVYYEVK